jgi:hypothetical protein
MCHRLDLHYIPIIFFVRFYSDDWEIDNDDNWDELHPDPKVA